MKGYPCVILQNQCNDVKYRYEYNLVVLCLLMLLYRTLYPVEES